MSTSVTLRCRCTKQENLSETKSVAGGDIGLWKQRVDALLSILKLTPKWVSGGFVSLFRPQSLKKEPKTVSFDELMGVDDIILEFQDIVSILHGKSDYNKCSAKLPDGVLLYGPWGVGKSTLVHAMANEARVPFFPVFAWDIEEGDVRIESLFKEARKCSPSIVFIDRVDIIASQQENCESDPALIQLHTEMEKCNKDGKMVMVIAATNSPEKLDPALMSSHWFEKAFHVSKPDEACRRRKISLYLKDCIIEEDKEAICSLVASETSGLVWANLKELVIQSKVAAATRGGDHVKINDVRDVTMDDVRHAIQRLNEWKSVKRMVERHNNPCDS